MRNIYVVISCAAALSPWFCQASSTNLVKMTPLSTFVSGTNATLVAATSHVHRIASEFEESAVTRANEYTDSAIQSAGSVTPQVVTNIVDAKIAALPKEGVSTNAVQGIIDENVRTNRLVVAGNGLAYYEESSLTNTGPYCWKVIENGNIYWTASIPYVGSVSRMYSDSTLDVYIVGRDGDPCVVGKTGNRYTSSFGDVIRVNSDGSMPVVTQKLGIDGSVVSNVAEAVVSPVSENASQALLYASGIYQFMTGNTNAWFSGTNYVTSADATNRTHFAWEEGMDAGTVPCSMAMWELRDGQRKAVWDQRDWTAWYWSFKASQLSNRLAAATGALADEVRTNCMRRGWANYTAVRGLDNPDPSALVVDTPSVQLFAGHQWEKLVETGGAGYWTLTGNGIELSASDSTNAFLTIKDFEGNACLIFKKTSSYLVYCECGTDITTNCWDNQGRVVFHLTTDVQPTAEFSTTLDLDSFVEQGDARCPANCEWTGSSGSWDCHFLLKPGIDANACFARFKIMREGENVVEHAVPIKISGGLVFEQDGQTRKIRPTISGNTVTWVVVQ